MEQRSAKITEHDTSHPFRVFSGLVYILITVRNENGGVPRETVFFDNVVQPREVSGPREDGVPRATAGDGGRLEPISDG